jgi:hypothetical protein
MDYRQSDKKIPEDSQRSKSGDEEREDVWLHPTGWESPHQTSHSVLTEAELYDTVPQGRNDPS